MKYDISLLINIFNPNKHITQSLFKFSNKLMLYHILLSLFPACFPDFIRQIARYHPRKIRITFSKTILKINMSKI